jgi:hypothetical protein
MYRKDFMRYRSLISGTLFLVLAVSVSVGQPVSEVLGRPTNTSMTLNVLFNADYDVYFLYGAQSGGYDVTTPTVSARAGQPLVSVFDKLKPDTKYYYRTVYRKAGVTQFTFGPEHSFRTQRAPGAGFTFDILADSHMYDKKGIPDMMRTTMSAVAGDAPDFVIDLGDTFGDDHTPESTTQKDMDDLHRDFLQYIGMVCHSAPFLFCLGNHEGENGYYLLQSPPNNIAVYGTLARKKYYSNPIPDGFYTGNAVPEPYGMGLPENYYAWQWGDAQFIVLDAYRGYTASEKPDKWDWTLGETQYQWFVNTLKHSTARYRFVFAHHVLGQGRGGTAIAPLYEWGGLTQKGNDEFATKRPGWEAPIHTLMEQNGVNVYFQGHDHLFAQESLDHVIYQEAPMPSDSTYTLGMIANADAYLSNQVPGAGYLRVSVFADSARVEFVRCWLPKDTSSTQRNGEVAFSYTVAPRGVTSIPDPVDGTGMRLDQNYPNPFGSRTSITFHVATRGPVTLGVHDLMGRRVAMLCDEALDPGTRSRSWDGRTNDGAPAPRGMYIIRLQTAAGLLVRQMMLR